MKRWCHWLVAFAAVLVSVAGASLDSAAQTPTVTPPATDRYLLTLGPGWSFLRGGDIETGEVSSVSAQFVGPEGARAHISETTIGLVTGRQQFQERVAWMDEASRGLHVPWSEAPLAAPDICALSHSVEGFDRLFGGPVGSTLCAIDAGLMFEVTIAGYWNDPGTAEIERLWASEASVGVLTRLIEQAD